MSQKRYIPRPWIIAATALIMIGLVLSVFVIGHFYLGAACIFFGLVILIYSWFHVSVVKYPRTIKIVRVFLSIILIVGMLYFSFLEILIFQDARTDTDREADYIIVLGAGVNGSTPSLSLRNRLDAALDYLEQHQQTTAIVSGGQGPGEDISEAQCMYNWLKEHGISDNRIIMEPHATSTDENLRYSMDILNELTDSEDQVIGIVSSEYHLHRAKLMAQRYGIDAVGIAGKTSYPTLTINYCIREAFGLTHYYVFGY